MRSRLWKGQCDVGAKHRLKVVIHLGVVGGASPLPPATTKASGFVSNYRLIDKPTKVSTPKRALRPYIKEFTHMKDKTSFAPDKRTWSPAPLLGQIVLVTTLNEDGQSNLAPKSWISMMAFEPSLLALGCNLAHWTARNILRSKEFVVNIPGAEMVDVVWRMSALPHPRPLEAAGLTPTPAQKVKPPLVNECKAHLECVLTQHLVFGQEVVLFGEIVAGSVDRAALECADPYEYLKMVAFLEDGAFGVIERSRRVG